MHLSADGFCGPIFCLSLTQARIETVVPKIKQCISGFLLHDFSTLDWFWPQNQNRLFYFKDAFPKLELID